MSRSILKSRMNKDFIVVFDTDEQPLIAHGEYKLNTEVLDSVAMILSNLRNQEIQVILVTAGSILAGLEKIGRADYPTQLTEKQAIAAIGQVDLIKRYQNIFDEYNHTIAQVLLARNITEIQKHRKNARNTFDELFNLGIIPVINENDTVSTEDIEQETNFPLTATVANIVEADVIIRVNSNKTFEVVRTGFPTEVIETKEELFSKIWECKRKGAFTPFQMTL